MDNKSFLVLADTNFNNNCVDSKEYVEKLLTVLKNNYGEDIVVKTITGKRGLEDVGVKMETLEVDDKNKTSLKESIENNISKFDYLILLTIAEDGFLTNVNKLCTEYKKTIIKYKYLPRG